MGVKPLLWTPDYAQGQLLTQLGFKLAIPPESAKGNTSMRKRQDIIQLSGEKMAEGLNGKTLMLFSADDRKFKELLANPFLQHLEAVEQHQGYAVGNDTLRLDYYSATNMLNSLEQQLKKSLFWHWQVERLPFLISSSDEVQGAVMIFNLLKYKN